MENSSAKILAVVGEPGSGKSTILKKIILLLGEPRQEFKKGKLRGYIYPLKKIFIPGVYDTSTFSGTDKLSMAVQRDWESFLIYSKETGMKIVFEGDRITNRKTFQALKSLGLNFKIFKILRSQEDLDALRKKRGSNQNETWLKGRATKLKKIEQEFHENVSAIENNQKPEETARQILNELGL